MNEFSHTTISEDAVVSRPLGSRMDIVTNPDGSTSGFCQVVSLTPFQYYDGTQLEFYTEMYIGAFAEYLAVKHLNEGDGSLVKELEGLNETCNIRFGLEFIDTQFNEQRAGRLVLNRLGAATEETNSRESHKFKPCFFLENSYIGNAHQISSYLTGLHGYTQLSGLVSELELNDKVMHPQFARTLADNAGTSRAIVKYAREVLKTRYMAILVSDDPAALSIAREIRAVAHLENTEEEFHVEEVLVDMSFNNIEAAIADLKRLRFNTVVAILPDTSYPYTGTEELMKEALKQGVAGNGAVTWIFEIYSIFAVAKPLAKGSQLYKAFQGSALVFSGDFRGPDHFKFLDEFIAFKSDDKEFEYFYSMLPRSDQLNATVDDFYNIMSIQSTWMRYTYDATVLGGLAACRTVNNSLYLDRDDFYKNVVNTEFQGASGFVKLYNDTGSRVTNTTVVTMLNLHDVYEGSRIPIDDGEDLFSFDLNPVGRFKYGKWEHVGEYVFSGGSSLPPREIPLIYDSDVFVLRTVTVVVASLLCAIPVILALGCAVWTRLNQHKRIVRASQPFFLYFISAGTIIFAFSIVPLTYDLTRTSHTGMDMACNAFLWLFFIGMSVVLSAFFAKTHRIVKIMKASERCKRVTITIKDAVIPMAIVLTCNILLLSVSTALDPVEYQPIPFGTPDRFGRTRLAYGRCDLETHRVFLALAGLLNAGMLCLCLYSAYQARNLATEFQETEHILKALIIGGGVLFIGLPVSALNRSDQDVRLYIQSVMIFAICNIVLYVMFAPKILYKEEKEPRNDVNVYTAEVTAAVSNESLDGEKIVTSKTRGELVQEITELRRRLAASMREA